MQTIDRQISKSNFVVTRPSRNSKIIAFLFWFSEFAALDSTAKELGLGDHIVIKLNRGSRMSGRQERYTIDTDKQLELEMPSILNGADQLLSK